MSVNLRKFNNLSEYKELFKMQDGLYDQLIEDTKFDIGDLPVSAIQIAGGLVCSHAAFPSFLTNWIINEMSKRTEMNQVSPIAEAAIRISIFADKVDQEYGLHEVASQYAFIKAMKKEEDFHIALVFFKKLAERYEHTINSWLKLHK